MTPAIRVRRMVAGIASIGLLTLVLDRMTAYRATRTELQVTLVEEAERKWLGREAARLDARLAAAMVERRAHPPHLFVESDLGAGAALASALGQLLVDVADDQPTYRVDPTPKGGAHRVRVAVAFTTDEGGFVEFLERALRAPVPMRIEVLTVTASTGGQATTLSVAATVSATYAPRPT